ncbi:MAG: hypothetical protein FWG75_01355 [Cystobacterineae bacterium]|nr:hypothetical protein [Cystobacterineae bacterium]
MNPLAELTHLSLKYFPLFSLFLLAGSLLVRFSVKRPAAVAPPSLEALPAQMQPQQAPFVSELALVFGLLGIVLLHVVSALYVVAPRLFPPLLLGFWELVFLSAWVGLVFGALEKVLLRAKAWRAGDRAQARPASYYALLALTGLSGIGMAVSCRWSSTWLGSAWKSWFVAAVDFGPDAAAAPGVLFAMPLAAPTCLLLVVCCCVVWPASGLSVGEVFPFRSVLKRLRQGEATTSSGA